MTPEKREYKLELLRNQKSNDQANYRKYLVNLYNYFLCESNKNNADWCCSDLNVMHKVIIEGCSNPDVSTAALIKYKKELVELGYIKNKLVEGVWRTYIIKELDF